MGEKIAVLIKFANFQSWAALLALAACLSSCSENEPAGKIFDLPSKSSNRVVIDSNDANVDEHWIVYSDGGASKQLERIEYRDGTSTFIYFGLNDFAEKLVEFYPVKSKDSKRQMKTEVFYMPQSANFKSHRAFLENGTLVKMGERLPDFTYKTLTFFDDGRTVKSEQIFAWDQFKISERIYRHNGSLSQATRTNLDRDIFVDSYDQSGKLWMSYKIPTQKWFAPTGEIFGADGKTVKINFGLYQEETVLDYLDANERQLFEVRFRKSEKEMQILAFNPATSSPIWEQTWKHSKGTFDCTGEFTLSRVDLFAKQSADGDFVRERRFTMALEGDKLAKLRIFNKDSETDGVDYLLYPSGYVALRQTFKDDLKIVSEHQYKDRVLKPRTKGFKLSLTRRPKLECPVLPDIELPEGDWSQ